MSRDILHAYDRGRIEAGMLGVMPQTCDILEEAYADDGDGGLTVTLAARASDVACRLAIKRGTNASVIRSKVGGKTQPITEFWLTVPKDTELRVGDVVEIEDIQYLVRQMPSFDGYSFARRAIVGIVGNVD